MDKKTLLWNYYADQRLQGRAFDTQRTSIGNFIITITAGLIALYSKGSSQEHQLLYLLFVIVISAFGLFSTLAFHLRQEYHFERARDALKKLDTLFEEEVITPIQNKRSSPGFKSFTIWSLLHGVILATALIFFFIQFAHYLEI